MVRKNRYCPEWSWWLRSGERLAVGLDVRKVLNGHLGRNRSQHSGLERCRAYLDQGESTVQALKFSGLTLPEEAWCVLRAGEKTGRLGESMCEVGEFLKQSQARQKEVIGQIWYPAVVTLTGFLVMGIILLWVVPQMKDISESMGQGGQVPWLTEHIGILYGGLFGVASVILLALLGGWRILLLLARRSLPSASLLEWMARRIPVIGNLRTTSREGRILRQLGTLMRGGITLPAALQMTADNSPDLFESHELKEFKKRLLMGISFDDSLASCRLFGAANHPMLLTGQETGQLDTFALRIADDADREISWRLQQVLCVVEPVIILTLAALVAGLVLAYMLPTISMLEQLA